MAVLVMQESNLSETQQKCQLCEPKRHSQELELCCGTTRSTSKDVLFKEYIFQLTQEFQLCDDLLQEYITDCFLRQLEIRNIYKFSLVTLYIVQRRLMHKLRKLGDHCFKSYGNERYIKVSRYQSNCFISPMYDLTQYQNLFY